ncbi:hypothetical protein LTR62_002124 [Meristemomyces frigidus]|uniref:Nucleoporin Pom152 n=1 Tax=Meristemomyces frigidus TaxID=1508187 RepID=A0AAN7T8U1_9PEZI|nr:hypothetical protein LTR62_002124 [Meristemomyces frigidus]
MEGTPRLRSAFPATPQTQPRPQQQRRSGGGAGGGAGGGGGAARFGDSGGSQRLSDRLPEIPILQAQTHTPPSPGEPLIPESVIDAPSQRLYAFAIWIALWCWKWYDWTTLQESDEQSLWLFMKWLAIDGIWLFGLPGLRIPWLEWSVGTLAVLFLAHAAADGMMMFRIPLPIMAGLGLVSKSVMGAYELAINEKKVNIRAVEFNESLILGRQIIHILPEGTAVLNHEQLSYCLGDGRSDIRLPITINATNPISMDIVRIDLDTQANETFHISRSQIKTMHKEASRLKNYGPGLNEPKTLYYTIKKPGLYSLAKVIDESNLEVARKRKAYTVVVPCPQAKILPAAADKCRGELNSVEFEVIGTPPMRVKYRKLVNQQAQEATFESIQPDDFTSPLTGSDHRTAHRTALTLSSSREAEWARARKVIVPISEGMSTAGRWVYAVSEIEDGMGNKVSYSERDHESQERSSKKSDLHQVITVHERPTIQLQGCTPQQPMKVATGERTSLTVQLGSTGRGIIPGTKYHVDYIFSPQDSISTTGEHGSMTKQHRRTLGVAPHAITVQNPGLYTITGVSTDFCRGEVFEPASCLLQNPPQPQLSVTSEEIFDKCAGSPIGLRVAFDLLGTPPFEIKYIMQKQGDRYHTTEVERIVGLRGQIELTPKTAGDYVYEFVEVSDAVYKRQPLKGLQISQSVKPAASASFVGRTLEKKVVCIDESVAFDVALSGEGPFLVEYELVHNGKRQQSSVKDVEDNQIQLRTEQLRDGGDYTLALVSITDRMQCKEFLKEEVKIAVRHQKPKVGFGQVDGGRTLSTLEGKEVHLPLRLAGEAPWTISYTDKNDRTHSKVVSNPNDRLSVNEQGVYQLVDVRDAFCPGLVDTSANTFEIGWIARPELRIPASEDAERKGDVVIKKDVCEGEDAAVEVLFKGQPPYLASYVQHVKPEHGTMAPKTKELRAALNVASLRLDTTQAGAYEYRFSGLSDANYDHSKQHFTPVSVQQRVQSRPSVAFTSPGKTYSYCSVESVGEEVIPITMHGAPPFDVEVEIKHHGSGKAETMQLTALPSHTHDLRVPHSRVQLGRSTISLRRIVDSRTCSRTLDSTTPRVQIAVFEAPTLTPLETQLDFCVGDRLNFALTGVPPFNIFYNFQGQDRKAAATGTTFRRLAERPGTFTLTGIQDHASQCRSPVNLTREIHGLPTVRVSHGKESYIDIHEGSETEILFEFTGVPPFEFSYTRSSNTDTSGKSKGKGLGKILDLRHEVSEGYSMAVKASEEGTYEVVAIRDRWCGFVKPGVDVRWGGEGRGRIGN